MTRILVYTFNFGNYDRIYPPLLREKGVDYAFFTDVSGLEVEGWKSIQVDSSRFTSLKAASVHCMALAHRTLPGYEYSVLIGGNFRIAKRVRPFVERFIDETCPISAFSHPVRNSVEAEAETCIADCKVDNPNLLKQQVASYKSDGFQDDIGLYETGVTLRNHAHPLFDTLMEAWWNEFERWPTRDQISLPFALWRTGTQVAIIPGSFRDRGSGFHLSPHFSRADVSRKYAHIHAMSAASIPHKVLLRLWHTKWSLQRRIRDLLGKN